MYALFIFFTLRCEPNYEPKYFILSSQTFKHSNAIILQVLERGYNIQDEVFLHREQRGKLPGMEILSNKEDRQWAAAGLEGKIVRR